MSPDYEKINTTILELESLELKFNNTLGLYKQAYANYIGSLRSPVGDNFNIKPDNIYKETVTQPQLDSNTAATVTECKTFCVANSLCKGATFTTTPGSVNSCIIYKGDGLLQEFTDKSIKKYAIIPAQTEYLNTIQILNGQLISLNQQINDKASSIVPETDRENIKKQEKAVILSDRYSNLVQERRNIDELIQSNIDVNAQYQDTSIIVEQSDSMYMFWIIAAIFTLLLTVKMILFPQINIGPIYFFIAIFIVLLIITTTRLNSSFGFTMGCLILAAIILFAIGMLPSK